MNPDIAMSEEDIYGQRHPVENNHLIEAKLKELDVELDKLPAEDAKGWTQAKAKCAPELVGDDFKLLFLRCEVFNPDLAAKRISKYWNKRIALFGPTKAFLPMTLDGALKDDQVALSVGFARLVPSTDPIGRSIVFVDPSTLDSSKYERESMCRATWYVLHAALQNVNSQKKGCIMLGFPKNAHVSQIDRGLLKLNMESLRGCIPVRISAFMLCHPPTFFALVFPIVKLFLGERLRKRIKVLAGENEQVLDELSKFGLTSDCLPTELGGQLALNHGDWLSNRKASDL